MDMDDKTILGGQSGGSYESYGEITPLPPLREAMTIAPSSRDEFFITVNLRGGRQHKVYRADKVSIKKLESSRQPVGDGWTYTYKISCSDCMLFRIATTD